MGGIVDGILFWVWSRLNGGLVGVFYFEGYDTRIGKKRRPEV